MSSSSAPLNPDPSPTKVSTLLASLAQINGTVGLVATIAGVAIPLVAGVVKKFKTDVFGATTVEFTLVLQTTQAELNSDISIAQQDLSDINAELQKMGRPPLQVVKPINVQAPAAPAKAAAPAPAPPPIPQAKG